MTANARTHEQLVNEATIAAWTGDARQAERTLEAWQSQIKPELDSLQYAPERAEAFYVAGLVGLVESEHPDMEYNDRQAALLQAESAQQHIEEQVGIVSGPRFTRAELLARGMWLSLCGRILAARAEEALGLNGQNTHTAMLEQALKNIRQANDVLVDPAPDILVARCENTLAGARVARALGRRHLELGFMKQAASTLSILGYFYPSSLQHKRGESAYYAELGQAQHDYALLMKARDAAISLA